MEADWSVEIGAELPSIAIPWAAEDLAFVDLRDCPEAALKLPEAQSFPALGRALACLNSAGSLVFTSKCDVWHPDDLDPLEMESTTENAKRGLACYIDLVRGGEEAFSPFAQQEAWIKRTTQTLRATPARSARAELVLRQATVETVCGEQRKGFGVTFYLTGCGRDEPAAHESWERALAAAVAILASAA